MGGVKGQPRGTQFWGFRYFRDTHVLTSLDGRFHWVLEADAAMKRAKQQDCRRLGVESSCSCGWGKLGFRLPLQRNLLWGWPKTWEKRSEKGDDKSQNAWLEMRTFVKIVASQYPEAPGAFSGRPDPFMWRWLGVSKALHKSGASG